MDLGLKPLPVDERGRVTDFVANGIKYLVRQPGEPLGIARWGIFEDLSISLGLGRSFKDIVADLDQIEKLIAEDGEFWKQRRDAILLLNSLKRAILEKSEERFSIAFYICTLFIVREGEDLKAWDETTANDKIKDWTKEGYFAEDFFFFALRGVEGFKKEFERAQTRLRETQSLLDTIESQKTGKKQRLKTQEKK